MKKTILETIMVLILVIFIGSCEKDDSILDTPNRESKEETLAKNNKNDENNEDNENNIEETTSFKQDVYVWK